MIDWTKPIETMDGKPAVVLFGPDRAGDRKINADFGNGMETVWVGSYGKWHTYRVRNVATMDEAEIMQRAREAAIVADAARWPGTPFNAKDCAVIRSGTKDSDRVSIIAAAHALRNRDVPLAVPEEAAVFALWQASEVGEPGYTLARVRDFPSFIAMLAAYRAGKAAS